MHSIIAGAFSIALALAALVRSFASIQHDKTTWIVVLFVLALAANILLRLLNGGAYRYYGYKRGEWISREGEPFLFYFSVWRDNLLLAGIAYVAWTQF